jgi:transcriptional regulator with XRE-family HTH domain
MGQEALLAHLLRALAEKSQEAVAEELGVHPSLIGHFERGRVVPGRDHLERLAAGAGITLREAEEILRLYEAFRRSRQARGRGGEELFDGLAQGVRAHAEAVYRRVLRMPLPGGNPAPEDRERAEGLWARLEPLPEESRSALVRVAEEFQSWALCERVCAESVLEAPRQVERAAGLVRLAQEIAERVPGPEGWRDRLQGYAAAHAANVLRVAGDAKAAEAAFASAELLWQRGSDPSDLLDRLNFHLDEKS